MTTTTKPEWMLSQNAIARRMARETTEMKGARGLVYALHTESCFALENVRLGHADIAADVNLRRARRALKRLNREDRVAPKGFEKALSAFLAANAALRAR